MTGFCDLHTHSNFSDGTYTPAQLISAAENMGLAAVALCDHNTVEGLPEFLAAGKGSAVEAVAGVELSTDYEGTELHILALFLEQRHFSAVTDLMEDFRQRKERSNEALVAALRGAGMVIDYEAVKDASGGYINRAHIAAELTRLGYTASIREAFQTLLTPDAGFYTPPARLDAFAAIRFIKSLGAVAVLAHPFLNLNEGELRVFLPKAVACGLDAMETMYPKYDTETACLAGFLAREFGLLPSGGSDFHGQNKPDICLGTGRGRLRVPAAFLEALRERRGLRKY